jgi:hypothetical protein
MASLGPKAAALLQAARTIDRPSRADRERVEAALRARLGSHALPPRGDMALSQRLAAWRATPQIPS